MVALDTDFDSKQAGAMRGTRTTGQGLGTLGSVGKFTSIAPFYSVQSSLFVLVLGEGHPSGHTEHSVPYAMPTESQEHKNILRRPFFLFKNIHQLA